MDPTAQPRTEAGPAQISTTLEDGVLLLTLNRPDKLNAFKLAYLHVMRADFFGVQKADVMPVAREKFKGVLVGNMGYSADEAEAAIAEGKLDAVAFGTAFLANPDLPTRIRAKAPLNAPDSNTFYTGGAKGYTDYPTLQVA